jgi:hypothetical protein
MGNSLVLERSKSDFFNLQRDGTTVTFYDCDIGAVILSFLLLFSVVMHFGRLLGREARRHMLASSVARRMHEDERIVQRCAKLIPGPYFSIFGQQRTGDITTLEHGYL